MVPIRRRCVSDACRPAVAQPRDAELAARPHARARRPRQDDGALCAPGVPQELVVGRDVLGIPLGAGRARIRRGPRRSRRPHGLPELAVPRSCARTELVDVLLHQRRDARPAAKRSRRGAPEPHGRKVREARRLLRCREWRDAVPVSDDLRREPVRLRRLLSAHTLT